jgi:hypothetical protein
MERLIDKIKNKLGQDLTNRSVDLTNIININKIKNVDINYDSENNKKLFIYKNLGIQVKNDVTIKIVFFKMNPLDNNDIEKLFELENIKIKSPNPLVVMYKLNEFWNAKLYIQSELDMLRYFCSQFNIRCSINGE